MVRLRFLDLAGLAFLALPVLATADVDAAPQVDLPATSADIICSVEDPTDCYPRVFQPTEKFQVIRAGQDLPPGLHVRMDIYSGKKEARLNIPMEGEEGSVEGLIDVPMERAIVVVPPMEEAQPEEEQAALRDQVPIKPPSYESAGKILPPPPGSDDYTTFQRALLAIKLESKAIDTALDDLADLSHDIYYGVEIAKDIPILERLICFTLGLGSEKLDAKTNNRDRKAASILASSIQNNPSALKEVKTYWSFLMKPTCPTLPENESRNKGEFVSTFRAGLGREKDPATLKAKVNAINGLLKEHLIRDEFLETKGMELLLAIFLKQGDEFDPVRKRVGQLVMDNFLDEGMGAQVGVWPTGQVNDYKTCETRGKMLKDGCWEHHVEAVLARLPEEEWAKDLLASLKEQRELREKPRRRSEL